jgi:pimeloyl-ACP methyl ester carboxylesterase
MGYWQWGQADASRVVLCVHGLTRQGRDFDVLAGALVQCSPLPLRVVCPDVVGRGQSDWLREPEGYQVPTYAADMVALLTHLNDEARIDDLSWFGTSMGGLIGMAVAGSPRLPLPAPVRRLVLNDVGPVLEWEALSRIGQYVGRAGTFASLDEAADAMWQISSGFGPHTPQQWRELSQHMVHTLPDGRLGLHYDPAIALPFKAVTRDGAQQGQAALWQLYDAIRADTLLTRGAESDLLSASTALEMTQRGPRARLVEFAGVGHAPTFVAVDQIDVATSFLLGPGGPP